jgi:hypothetical protein
MQYSVRYNDSTPCRTINCTPAVDALVQQMLASQCPSQPQEKPLPTKMPQKHTRPRLAAQPLARISKELNKPNQSMQLHVR